MQRGAGSSRKGRPINSTVPYKGELSSSSRAVAQRDRATMLDEEGQALKKSGDADRAAKSVLLNKIKKSEKYLALSKEGKEQMEAAELEELQEKRFRQQKSG